jgi:pyrimidine-nucleoside phosphorylase
MVGNFLEVEESFDCLEAKGPGDLMDLSLDLAARMVFLAGKAKNAAEGRALCEKALASGEPRERFLANIAAQGGDVEEFLRLRGNYRSSSKAEVRASRSGYISRIDAGKVGHAGVGLGVGRNRTEDQVSPTAGLQFHVKRGSRVSGGDLIMSVWARDEASLAGALPQLQDAVEYSEAKPPERKLILKEIDG